MNKNANFKIKLIFPFLSKEDAVENFDKLVFEKLSS